MPYQYLEFEKQFTQCNNISQVRNLIRELPDKNAQLARESCSKTINHIVEGIQHHHKRRCSRERYRL